MDIGTASALNLYDYQAALRSLAQPSAAVLGALVSAYAGTDAGLGGLLPSADPLTSLAGSGALASLADGIQASAAASGGSALPLLLQGLAGGLEAGSLLATAGPGSLSGLAAADLFLSTTLALQAYGNATGSAGPAGAASALQAFEALGTWNLLG